MTPRDALLATAEGLLPPRAEQFTLYLRLPAVTMRRRPLLDLTGGEPGRGLRIQGALLDELPSVVCEVHFDWDHPRNDRPLTVSVPCAELPTGRCHLVLRCTGPRLELWVNGLLRDEEWPVGGVLLPEVPARQRSWACWPRALSDAEMADLYPLAPSPDPPLSPYWKPRGHDAGVYDCMPYAEPGRFHLFYLLDRRAHRSKWGLGAHQWGHCSTADLETWTHHPPAVPITDQAEGSICTGSGLAHDGRHYAFYAVRAVDGGPARLTWAVSDDGVAFHKTGAAVTLTEPYAPAPARDPVVLRDPASGRFHMLVTTELQEPTVAGHGGCLAQLVSDDLEHWEQLEPLVVPGYPDQPECADWFEWNGTWYLIFSNHGVARYRWSRSPLGPWQRPVVEAFDGLQLRVLKTAAFGPTRRLGVGWLPAAHRRWGGEMVFRELVQQSDGELGTRFVPELTPAAGGPTLFEPNQVELNAGCGLVEAELAPVPVALRLRLRCELQPPGGAFGLRLGDLELRCEPARRKVGWRPVRAASTAEHEGGALYEVSGLARPFSLDLVATGDLLDLCVDGRRTLVVRSSWQPGAVLRLFAHDAAVRFTGVEAWPLSV